MRKEIKKFKTKYDYCKFQFDKLLHFLGNFENITEKDNIFKTYKFYNEVNKRIDVTIANADKYHIFIRYDECYFHLKLNKNCIIFKVEDGSLMIPIINIFFNEKYKMPIGNILNLEYYITNIINALNFDRKLIGIKLDNENRI